MLTFKLRADNDVFAHLNNPIYIVLVDSVINSYLIKNCGYSTTTSKNIGLVANTYCDFFGSARYPNMLDVGMRFVKMGKSSILYEVGVFEEGSEDVKAVGGFTQIWVDRQSNKVTEEGIPKAVREPLQPLLKNSEQDPALAKL